MPERDPDKLILHIDVDAFFPSVEQLLIPALRGRPVVVGNGVAASCSYEARELGVRTGMPLHEVRRICPQAEILDGNYQTYRCFAEHVWEVTRNYTVALETFLDEAYGNATGMEGIHGRPDQLGRSLQEAVRRLVGLPVTVGLAKNRMLAKMASSSVKPFGVRWLRPGEEMDFLVPLPVEKLLGVGHKTHHQLKDLNIHTIGQLRGLPRKTLSGMFGKRGEILYDRARGEDTQPLRPDTLPKTISRETTFHEPTSDPEQIRGMLFYLLERAMRTMRSQELQMRTVELSICYNDWKRQVASKTLHEPTASDDTVFEILLRLLDRLHSRRVSLRHVGVTLSKFSPRGTNLPLFEAEKECRDRRLHHAVDAVRDKFGHASMITGKSIALLGHLDRNDYGFVLRTPSLTK
ncbi:MAG: DNA polymerase thumb domain-containing protein [Phycisphaerae bacterium]